MNIFISYSRSNITFAERIARDLDDAGLDVWIDVRKLRGGRTWQDAIIEGINRADILIVCLSENAVNSEWVRREVFMARSQSKLVIPLLLDDVLELLTDFDEMRWLVDIQMVDFRQEYEQAFPKLLYALPGRTMMFSVPTAPDKQLDEAVIPNPFKGLQSFQQTDADVFFGREDLIERILQKIHDQRHLVALVGASGSGKSSVVRAGLIPVLRNGAIKTSDTWPIAIFTPGSRPTEALAIRLMPILGETLLPNLMGALERGADSLHQITEGFLADKSATARFVLVVDQFEEVFTRASRTEADTFLKLLVAAATIENGRTLIIVTMRADFFDRLSAYPQLARLFEQDNMVIATDMTADNLRKSIEGPAAAVGLVYDHGLTDRILEDVRQQPGSLPLLQYTLQELYENRDRRRLTFEAYERIGGVRRALAKHAEDIYEEFDANQQKLMRRILLQLIEVDETGEATRRKVDRSELTFKDVMDNDVFGILNKLTASDSRLLVTSREISNDEHPDSEPRVWVEISHEALLREWGRFAGWVIENAENLHYGSDLLKDAQDWENANYSVEYLIAGTRLQRAQAWLQFSDPNKLQRDFIEKSVEEFNRHQSKEQARQQRELVLQRQAANRSRYAAGILGAFLLITFGLAIFAFRESDEARSQGDLANTNEANAISNGETAEAEATNANIAWATSDRRREQSQSYLWASGAQNEYNNDNDVGINLAIASARIDNPPYIARDTLAKLRYSPGRIRQLAQYHTAEVLSIAISSDGQTALSASADNTLILWDIVSGEPLNILRGHTDSVTSAVYSPDGQTALSASHDSNLILWDLVNGEALLTLSGHTSLVNDVTLDSSGQFALSASSDDTLILWDLASGESIRMFRGHTEDVTSVAVSPDGQTAISASKDHTLIIWDLASGESVRTFEGHTEDVTSVAFSPDGQTAVSASLDNTLILWDITNGKIIRTLAGHTGRVNSVAYSSDGQTILSASQDNTLILWDINSGTLLHILTGHSDEVLSVGYSPDDEIAISSSRNKEIIIWSLRTHEHILFSPGHDDLIYSVAYSPGGQTALSASCNQRTPGGSCILGEIVVWDTETGKPIRTLVGHTGIIWSVAFSPDSKTALSASSDSTLILWDIATGKSIRTLEGHTNSVWDVDFSPNGKFAVSASGDDTAIIWDISSGQILHTLQGHTDDVWSAAFSPDSQMVITGSVENTAKLWDVQTGALINTLSQQTGRIWGVDFSPDGQFVITASQDKTVIVWNVKTGKPDKTLIGHTNGVWSVAYSPDGLTIVAGSCEGKTTSGSCRQGKLILWDAKTGEILRSLIAHSDWILDVAYSPDSRSIIFGFCSDETTSGCGQSQIGLWTLTTIDELVQWIYSVRNVNELECTERNLYNFEPACDENDIYPTRTPYMTATPTIINPTQTSTPTILPSPSLTEE